MERNEAFLRKAENLKPRLHTRTVSVPGSGQPLKKGDSACFDLGEHLVGDVTVKLIADGRSYTGKGLSTDVMEASILAYITAVNKLCAATAKKEE